MLDQMKLLKQFESIEEYKEGTYAKLHNEGVNNTSNDRYEIERIPWIFEKILQKDGGVWEDATYWNE